MMFGLAGLLLSWLAISHYFVRQHDPGPQPIAFVLFASGLLSGAPFPKVSVISKPPGGLPLFLPLNSVNDVSFAMLMVWSFVAGFAERLIPDALDRLATQAEKQKFSGANPDPSP